MSCCASAHRAKHSGDSSVLVQQHDSHTKRGGVGLWSTDASRQLQNKSGFWCCTALLLYKSRGRLGSSQTFYYFTRTALSNVLRSVKIILLNEYEYIWIWLFVRWNEIITISEPKYQICDIKLRAMSSYRLLVPSGLPSWITGLLNRIGLSSLSALCFSYFYSFIFTARS